VARNRVMTALSAAALLGLLVGCGSDADSSTASDSGPGVLQSSAQPPSGSEPVQPARCSGPREQQMQEWWHGMFGERQWPEHTGRIDTEMMHHNHQRMFRQWADAESMWPMMRWHPHSPAMRGQGC